MSLGFLLQVKVEKTPKLTKNSSNRRSKNSYLLRVWNIFFGLRHGFFVNETSMFVLAELEIFYLNKNELWKIGKFFGKEGMTPDICLWYLSTYVTYAKILAHVRDHVRRFRGNCQTMKSLVPLELFYNFAQLKGPRETWKLC